MADEPTPWELHRTVEALRRTVEAGFSGLNSRLDRVVSNELFQAYQQGVQRQFEEQDKEIATLKAELAAEKKERENEKAQRTTDRKVLLTVAFTSIIAPLAILLVQLWLSKGS